MIPHRAPFFLPLLYPSLYWRMPAEGKVLYLTFDDGPMPGPTEFVLDTLDRYAIKATFFCIGNNIHKHRELFQRIVSGGHRTGNHTYSHLNGWGSSADAYLDDIDRCDDVIDEIGPHSVTKSRLFRPPYGRITRRQIRLLAGRPVVMWDVLSVDYDHRLPPGKCLQNTLRVVRPGSIVVYHDSQKAERNLTYSLPRMIDECLKRGYTFSPITL